MRARACEVYGIYSDLEYKGETHYEDAVRKIWENLRHASLSVRFHSACALAKFLTNDAAQALMAEKDDGRKHFKAGDKLLLVEYYLGLMNEVENKELEVAFQRVVNICFGALQQYGGELFRRFK